MSIQAMKQALEALEHLGLAKNTRERAIIALRAAIEAAEKCEPVAWITGGDCYEDGHMDCFAWTTGEFTTPLYAHPQPAIPEGWQLVPVEPTPNMLQEAGTIDGWDGWPHMADECHTKWWASMLAAAPKPEDEP